MATTTAVSRRAKIVYIIEWVLISLSLLGLIGAVIYYSVNFSKFVDQVISKDPDSIRREDAEAVLRIYIILFGVIGGILILIEIGMNTLLMKGVSSRYHKYCKIWLIIKAVFFVLVGLGLIFVIVNVIKGYQLTNNLIVLGIGIIYIIGRMVTLKFIKDFMAEVEEHPPTGRVEPAEQAESIELI